MLLTYCFLVQEQFVDAAGEFQKCLDLQLKHLEPDDRLIAETYPSLQSNYSQNPIGWLPLGKW